MVNEPVTTQSPVSVPSATPAVLDINTNHLQQMTRVRCFNLFVANIYMMYSMYIGFFDYGIRTNLYHDDDDLVVLVKSSRKVQLKLALQGCLLIPFTILALF